MTTLKFKIASLLTIFLLISSCSKVDINEETNDLLNGTWEATSFIFDENNEGINGDIEKNSLIFLKDSLNVGQMDWNIITEYVTLEGWSGPYTIWNEGERLTFFDNEFSLSLEDDVLTLVLLNNSEPFTIQAKMK